MERLTPVKLEFKQVVSAVASLYDDQLKPFGRILLKRVGERACADGKDCQAAHTPFIDARRLRSVCESCPRLLVEDLAGGEYVVLLHDRARAFMDPGDAHDHYPKALWEELSQYFSEEGEGSNLPLPGGRYACARALMTRGLPCLEGRSLGEVCHIVALAVTQRRILGYSDGGTVPFNRSEAKMKEMCAAHQLPIYGTRGSVSSLTIATWEATRACLWELLANAEDRSGAGLIPVPNVKRLFRSQYQLELSETALGHSRLQDLLNDPQLRDICEVRQCGNVNVVAKAHHSLPPTHAVPALGCGAAGHYFVGQPDAAAMPAVPAVPELPWHGAAGQHLLSTPGPNGAPVGAPLGDAAGYCEQGYCVQGYQGVYDYGHGAIWDQHLNPLDRQRPRESIWQDHYHYHCQELPQAAANEAMMQPHEVGSDRTVPLCLSSGAFFDFLGQEDVKPAIAASPLSTTSTVSATLSEVSSGHASDTEATENERCNEELAASLQNSEVSSETADKIDSPRVFWEQLAQEEFGKPFVVTKNTFIHISPDSLAQRASFGAPARCRHKSVPCSVRLNA